MDLELFLVGTCLIVWSAALFIWRAIPPWAWFLLVATLALAGERLTGIHLRQPQNEREACEWECDAKYGHRSDYEHKLELCLGTCP
jgi:hypothetical protein